MTGCTPHSWLSQAARAVACALTALAPLVAGCARGNTAAAVGPEDVARDDPPAVIDDGLPRQLSSLHIFADAGTLTPGADTTVFTVKYPSWNDGAAKLRTISLPPSGRLSVDGDGQLRFPAGTLLSQTLTMKEGASGADRRIETRVELKREGRRWAYATYVWDDARAEALRTNNEEQVLGTVLGDGRTRYVVPARLACVQCHAGQPDSAIGFSPWQLTDEFLEQLESGHRLSTPVAMIANHTVQGASALEKETFGYVAGNCAHCHNPASTTFQGTELDLRHFRLKRSLTNTRARRLSRPDAQVYVEAGVPERSVVFRLFERTFRDDSHHSDLPKYMPPIGNQLVDPHGRDLLERWIKAEPH